MKYSKKKYLDFMVRTIDALNNPEGQPHFFINNPGFGNIFDILKNEADGLSSAVGHSRGILTSGVRGDRVGFLAEDLDPYRASLVADCMGRRKLLRGP